MTRKELARLRELASKATPGPWTMQRDDADAGDIYYALYGGPDFDFIANIHERKHDAAFIAAANPSTITALLDHIARLEREAKAGRECYYALTDFYAMVEGESPSLLEDDCNAIRANEAIKTYDAAVAATKETASEVS